MIATMGVTMSVRSVTRKAMQAYCRFFSVWATMLLVILASSACQKQPGTASLPSASANMSVTDFQTFTPDMQNAFCEGWASDIVALLKEEPISAPADRFFLALSLESVGNAIAARDIYRDLAASHKAGGIDIACGGELVVRGSIAEEALFRLARLEEALKDLDVIEKPQNALHQGVPPGSLAAFSVLDTFGASSEKGSGAGRDKISAIPQKAPQKIPQKAPWIKAPASASQSGLFFAHLASYKAEENVVSGLARLGALYPGILDVLSRWQITLSGETVWRVGVRTIDFSDAEGLCSDIKATGAYCRVLDTTQ